MQNKTEEVTFRICRTSFLSLWSYANPRGQNNAELCDVLVVCDPNVIIISVKDVTFKPEGDPEIQLTRWYRRAVLESIEQVYGAERWITSDRVAMVVRSDGTPGVEFPRRDRRRIHRVVIAIGGPVGAPLPFGHFGKGFVHVFDAAIFETVLRTLDTVTDFSDYLAAKERLYQTSPENVLCDGELDLLAWYLGNARTFSMLEPILPPPNAWNRLASSAEFSAKREADEDSYLWDVIIEMVSHDIADGTLEISQPLSECEQIVRVMAREPRLSRRVLSQALWQFFDRARADGWASRMAKSPNRNVGYVFLARNAAVSKDQRAKELRVRCLIARATLPDVQTIVGLATEVPGTAPHISWVVTCFDPPSWTAHDRLFAECMSRLSGMFSEVQQHSGYEPEFPVPKSGEE